MDGAGHQVLPQIILQLFTPEKYFTDSLNIKSVENRP